MRVEQGGTKMWCPKCQTICACAAVSLTDLGKAPGQRWHRTDHPDINWFRRGRECTDCGHNFVTAEMNENFLGELVTLRNALADVKQNAEQYIEESNTASKSLKKLGQSLKVLKALRVYKQTGK